MIPKVIHYCWFGRSSLPPLAQKCIASWKKFLPDYEIKEWNEENFDVSQIPYTKQAYKNKKYAFVSDFARFKILYENGGIYFDTDVEVIKPLDDILSKGAFLGLEQDIKDGLACNPGLGMACEANSPTLQAIIESYEKRFFENSDGTLNCKTVVEYTSEFMKNHQIKIQSGIIEFQDFSIYPKDYFCPKSSEFEKIILTENTRTIHHYAGSWISKRQRFANILIKILGKRVVLALWSFIK